MTHFDVFLSHNSKDEPAVRELAEELLTRGLKVWLDEWELVPGRPWQEALEEVIQTCRSSAVLVGKDGLGPWHAAEMRGCLTEFVRRKLPVIPVLLPGAPAAPKLPLFLTEFTWVDLRRGLTREGLDRLQWGVTGKRPDRSKPLPSLNLAQQAPAEMKATPPDLHALAAAVAQKQQDQGPGTPLVALRELLGRWDQHLLGSEKGREEARREVKMGGDRESVAGVLRRVGWSLIAIALLVSVIALYMERAKTSRPPNSERTAPHQVQASASIAHALLAVKPGSSPEIKVQVPLVVKSITIRPFTPASDELDATARRAIDDQVSPLLQTFSGTYIRVEGNTDATGSQRSLVTLSEHRAQAVVNYIVAKYHPQAKKFLVIGRGGANPVADNATEQGRAMNRRVDINFLAGKM